MSIFQNFDQSQCCDERGTLFNAISGLGEGGENKPPLKRKADSARLAQCAIPGTIDAKAEINGLAMSNGPNAPTVHQGFSTDTVNPVQP